MTHVGTFQIRRLGRSLFHKYLARIVLLESYAAGKPWEAGGTDALQDRIFLEEATQDVGLKAADAGVVPGIFLELRQHLRDERLQSTNTRPCCYCWWQ